MLDLYCYKIKRNGQSIPFSKWTEHEGERAQCCERASVQRRVKWLVWRRNTLSLDICECLSALWVSDSSLDHYKAVCLCEHLWMMTSSRQTQPSLVGVGSNNGAAPSIHRQLYYFLSDPNIISAIHIQQLKPRRIHNFSITFTAVIVIVPSLLSELLIGSDFTKSDLVAI